jgi:DNA-binding NarL/FixJ family response regulator
MASDNQSDIDSRIEETFLDEPCVTILDEKEWSYLQRYYGMSPRELQVAKLVCHGLTNGDIAHRLRVRPGTVKTHLRSVFGKTQTRNRISMLLKYIEKVQLFNHQSNIRYVTTAENGQQKK